MSADTLLLLVRLGFSLALVFGLMWVAGRVVKGRSPLAARRNDDHVEIIERKALSRNTSVAVVRVGDNVFALGVSESNVTVLGEVTVEANLDGTAQPTVVELDAVSMGPAHIPVSTSAIGSPADGGHAATRPATTRPIEGRGWLDSLRDKTVRHIPS
ncbi:MAG: FliO/MopB family protein [Microthrixaceae bacterium]|nr:FliO/MopB family protein [Microthrixaceae bacterium]